MRKFLRRLKKTKDDKGASNTISFMVIMLFIMTMIVSFIDVGLYFNTKNQMISAAEAGARSVALYGGVDTVVRDVRGGSTSPEDLAYIAIPDSYKNPTANRTVIVRRSGINCEPHSGRIEAGEPVWCDVTYTYNGIAGRFSLFNLGRGTRNSNDSMTVRGTSVSEVTID